jgi:diguanylate cyclase (GGDEF)-like protein/PAS domain S-box-containing protein
MKHAAFPTEWDSDGTHRCLAETVLESTHQAIVILDKYRYRIVYANPAFVTMTGYTIDEIKGKSLPHVKSKRHNTAFYQQIWTSLEEKGHWSGEIWGRRKNGEDYPSLHTISPIFDSRHGRTIYYVSAFCDITTIKRQQADVGHLAYHDALTGLPNRLVLIDRLQHALRTHTRDNAQLAVLYVDLDGFKRVNDTLGHAVGDQLLQATAGRFQSILRSGDTVARLGGDEFVVLAESCPSRRGIARIAEKAIQKIAEPLHIAQHDIEVQASIGIAFSPQDGKDADAILQAADQAMYQAKINRGGGGAFCFFDEL